MLIRARVRELSMQGSMRAQVNLVTRDQWESERPMDTCRSLFENH